MNNEELLKDNLKLLKFISGYYKIISLSKDNTIKLDNIELSLTNVNSMIEKLVDMQIKKYENLIVFGDKKNDLQ